MSAPDDQPSAQTGELIARLEAAEVGSREMDAEIGILLDGLFVCKPRYEGQSIAYGYIDSDGARVEPGHGGYQLVHRFTTSLDAALALAERVLPSGEWMVIVNPNHGDGGFSYAGLETTDTKINVAHPGKVPALALCIAILRATGSPR